MNAKKLLMTVALLGMAQGAWAIPFLQLDASPSTYNSANEDIQATANPFTLYALVNSESGEADSDWTTQPYFLSAAIVKNGDNGIPSTDMSFGSFTINGKTYPFKYGAPPIEPAIGREANDLSPHGVFETYFIELPFTLNLNNRASLYNTEEKPDGLTKNQLGTLYYEEWTIDVSGMNAGYDVHFDLYTTIAPVWVAATYNHKDEIKTPGHWEPGEQDYQIDKFAPFSHDAISGPHDDFSPIPDASTTVTLLGMAMIGLGMLQRRIRK